VHDGEEHELFELAEALMCHGAERIQRQHKTDKCERPLFVRKVGRRVR
jgi:hypothetical protein